MALVTLRDLRVSYRTSRGALHAVDGVSLDILEGEYLGIVGESGCGKSTLAAAIIQILADNGSISGGEVIYNDQVISSMSERQLNRIRWSEISFISQAALNSLDPSYRVRDQIFEAINAHEKVSTSDALDRIARTFEMVGLDQSRLDDYPHQLSGGMRQRVIIAMAMILDPALIIADEPTTALDVLVQEQILRRIREIRRDTGKAMVIITHDIGVVAENCQRVGVMYAGKLVEIGSVSTVLKKPAMPYTMGLQNAFPSLLMTKELISIPGSPPNLIDPPSGCRFRERCPFAIPICADEEPLLSQVGPNHFAACHRAGEADELRLLASQAETWVKK